MENLGIAMVGLWVPAVINLVGIRQMAWFQNITVVLKFLPLLFVGVIGWFFVDKAHFGPFNASGGSLYSGIGIAAGVALFSFIGVEAAAMTAKRVKNPRVNVGRASMLGTALSAILYVLVTAAVMGLVSHHTLVNTGSPFVNAFQSIFPHEAWAGKFIAAIAVISGIGALNGWTLIVTETSRAIAQDDMFPRPFAWTDRKGTAWFGIVVGTALPSLLMLWRYTTTSGLTVFTYLVDLTVVTVAIPYFMSAIAQLTYLVSRRRKVQGWLLARDLSVAGASVLFSMWVTFASGYQVVYQALVVILAGLILYAFLNARRQRLGETGGAGGCSRRDPPVAAAVGNGATATAPLVHVRRSGGELMAFNVASEVGQLRQAIVHRPGLELSRLTPENIGELLFDDVMWAKRAKEEHDAFAEALRDKGVQVHLYGQLLAETLELPEGRAFVLDRVCTPEILGPSLVGPARRLFEDLDGPGLAQYLVGGVLKADLQPLRAHSLKWDMLRADDFVLTPLPNHLFQRDNSCWIYGGVTVNPMAKPARQRESLHTRAIYRFHPLFADADFITYYGDEDRSYQPATIEGGDVHVIGNGAVLIGMGERTTPMAVEIVAHALFDAGQATTVVAIELPRSHAFMHLDTVMSMVDKGTFVLYPYFDRHLRSWTITKGERAGRTGRSAAITTCGTLWPSCWRSPRSPC